MMGAHAAPALTHRGHLWPLALSVETRTGFTATLRASFLLLLLYLTLLGTMAQELASAFGGRGTPAGFVALVLAGAVVHEGGHVLGYRLTGHRWRSLTLKFGARVAAEGTFTPAQTLCTSALGPLLEALFGAGLLGCCTVPSVGWLAGLFVVVNAAAGLLIPLSNNSDAAKLHDAAWHLFTARLSRRR